MAQATTKPALHRPSFSQEFNFSDVPTYEYKCTNDGSTFDIWQEVGSPAPPCPDCGAPTKKVFQPPRVIFKGSGFYVTDTRSEASGSKSGGDKKGAESNGETGSDKGEKSATETTSSDAKTEAKPETPKPSASPNQSAKNN